MILIDAAVVCAPALAVAGSGPSWSRTVLATRAGEWWLECREQRVAFYERLGFAVVRADAVPAIVAARVGANPDRRQCFLRRSTDAYLTPATVRSGPP